MYKVDEFVYFSYHNYNSGAQEKRLGRIVSPSINFDDPDKPFQYFVAHLGTHIPLVTLVLASNIEPIEAQELMRLTYG